MSNPAGYVPQVGDIGLVQINGFVGNAIEWGQKLNGDGFEMWEHAFVVTDEPGTNGGLTIVEAEPGGARLSNLNYAAIWWCVGLSHGLDPLVRADISSQAIEFIGTGYSFLDYFALAMHRLHVPAPGLKDFIASSKHEVCSQLADQAYENAGVHIFDDGRWPGYVTPGALYQQDLLLRAKYSLGA